MKFIIKKKKLIKLLSKFNSFVSINPKNPILSNILLSLNKNFLFLTVTNLDIEIGYKLFLSKKNILNKGDITVNIRKLYDICKTFPKDSDLLFKLYNNKIKIFCLNSVLCLSILPSSDFPILNKNQFNFKYKFIIFSFLFKDIVNSIYFSIGNNDIHCYLNGMLIEYINDTFYFVTTDSYRLSIYKVCNNSNLIINFNKNNFFFILPKKLVVELYKLLDLFNENKKIILEINENIIKISFENFIIYSSLIDGDFPDYKKILYLTKSNYNYIDLNIKDFRNSLLRSSIISSYSFNYVTLTLKKNILKIYSNNTFSDEIKDIICVNYIGNSFKINLNVKFILDILNVIKNSLKIRFYFKNSDSIIKIDDTKNKYIIYMVMPINL